MAPGPRGHGGFGGHRGGGPRGGGFGGPHGGFGGPHGGFFGGPHGRPRRHIRVVPPTYTGGTTNGGQSSEYVDENGKPIDESTYLRKKFGTLKGIRMTLQLATNGAMKEEMFKARCATADELLKDKRITAQEAVKRKMDAVNIFYGYLRDIEYWTPEEYDTAMADFAQKNGGTYTPASNSNSNTNTRRR